MPDNLSAEAELILSVDKFISSGRSAANREAAMLPFALPDEQVTEKKEG